MKPSISESDPISMRRAILALAQQVDDLPSSVPGTGDVLGPGTNTDNYVPQWDGTNTKTLKNGVPIVTSVGSPGSDSALASEQAIREAIAAISAGDVYGPATNHDNYLAQWNGANSKTLKDGLSVVTTIGTPGSDSAVPTEQAVREAIDAIPSSRVSIGCTVSQGQFAADGFKHQLAMLTFDTTIARANPVIWTFGQESDGVRCGAAWNIGTDEVQGFDSGYDNLQNAVAGLSYYWSYVRTSAGVSDTPYGTLCWAQAATSAFDVSHKSVYTGYGLTDTNGKYTVAMYRVYTALDAAAYYFKLWMAGDYLGYKVQSVSFSAYS